MLKIKMDSPKHFDDYFFKVIAIIFAASITGLLSKEPLVTKIKNWCAGLMGGGIVIILSMGYVVQPWWTAPACVIVTASISSFWPMIINWFVVIADLIGKKWFDKVKNDDLGEK